MPATSWIQQMIDDVYHEVNDPSSQYYLPQWIVANHYDPYTGLPYNPSSKGFPWNFGQMQQQAFISAAASICPTISETGDYCLGYQNAPTPPNYPTLNLTEVSVTGLSNAVLGEPQLQSDGITLVTTVDFSTLPKYPTPVTIAGNFSLTVYCCCPPANPPGSSCPQDTATDTQTGAGTFTATIPSCSAQLTCKINNLDSPGVIPTLTATNFIFTIPNNPSTQGPSMNIIVDITSVPANQQQAWNKQAMKVFNDPAALTAILNTLISAMNGPNELQTLGNILTTQLDNYLRAQGLYPYPASFARLF